MELTSPRPARLAAVRKLLKRSVRQERRQFLVEGPQAVREALTAASGAPGAVRELYLTRQFADRHPDFVEAADSTGLNPMVVRPEALATLTDTVNPQGVIAVCDFVDVTLADLPSPLRRVVVLASVRDPGNAGTVLRTADASGADAVIFSDASVDVYNAKCVRAAVGSHWHVPVVAPAPVADTVRFLHDAGLQVLAADGAGPHDLDDLLDAGTLAQPTAWLFGNEAWGLPAEVSDLADAAVRVPIHGRAESLNLATAAAVCLYATARAQRRT